MLYDLGLPDEEYYKRQRELKEWESKQSQPYIPRGCISERLCAGCGHRISDSICLCVPIFTCPNCNFRNGEDIRKMMDEIPTGTSISPEFFYDYNKDYSI